MQFSTSSEFGIGAKRGAGSQPVTGGISWLTAPYRQRYVPAVNLNNTDRLESFIRGGNLYLSAQDVIALALENNLDIEIQRYQPLLTKELTRRAQGGGLLRAVGVGVAAGPTSVSLTGVSLNSTRRLRMARRISVPPRCITSVGPSPPNLDPNDLRGGASSGTPPLRLATWF